MFAVDVAIARTREMIRLKVYTCDSALKLLHIRRIFYRSKPFGFSIPYNKHVVYERSILP